jgi:formate dehydrogenase major subunit
MTFHFPDEVATNELTVDAVDPKSGTSEFKATAVRIERVVPSVEPDSTTVEEVVAGD